MADVGTEMLAILKDFYYDEGWAFDLSAQQVSPYFSTYHLAVLHSVPDVNTGKKIPVGGLYTVPSYAEQAPEGTREYLLRWLVNLITELEIHEVMEKFEFEGKAIFHPHGPNGETYSSPKFHPDPPVTNRKPDPRQLELKPNGYAMGSFGFTPSWTMDRPAQEMAELRSLARQLGRS